MILEYNSVSYLGSFEEKPCVVEEEFVDPIAEFWRNLEEATRAIRAQRSNWTPGASLLSRDIGVLAIEEVICEQERWRFSPDAADAIEEMRAFMLPTVSA